MMNKDIEFVGISNAPSDYSAQDGVMSHLVNLIPEEGELKAVGKGRCLWNVNDKYRLLFVHSVTSESEHYIFFKDNTLYYQTSPTAEDGDSGFKEIGYVAGLPKIVSVGNTLIAYSENEMRYFLWKSYGTPASTNKPLFQYVDLGTHLPEPDVRFMLKKYFYDDSWSEQDKKELVVSSTKILFKCKPNDPNWGKEENQRYIEEQVCALVNKAHQTVSYYGAFMFPFLVRYAYRLYDGSTLTLHSAPILMLPSMSDAVQIVGNMLLDNDTKLQAWVRWLSGKLFCKVIYKSADLFNFGDIIQSIDIFVSAPIYTYKQGGLDAINDTSKYDILSETVSSFGFLASDDISEYDSKGLIPLPNTFHFVDQELEGSYFIRPPRYSDSEIQKDVSTKSLFYLLKSIPFTTDGVGSYSQFVQIPIPKGYLTSLVNKEVMTDDYDSHDLLKPQSAFVYNSRLNIANISKSLFRGWDANEMSFVSGFRADSKKIEIKNRIKTEYGDVVKGASAVSVNNLGFYFYYPNTRASEMILSDGDSTAHLPLRPHDLLNGAFAIIPFWENVKSVLGYLNWKAEPLPTTSDFDIVLSNKVYTSVINMPFYFPVAGINTVGSGEIIGLSSTTQALSEGQFGQYPLYAFTDEGIWALQTNENGGISSVTPVTRDVVNNADSITQIDDAILFSSNRGLMVLQGSQTQCLSEALDGEWFSPSALPGFTKLLAPDRISFESFKGFLSGSRIAYDYVEQRILICNPGNVFAPTYSLRSKQWGEVRTGKVVAIVNSYPNSVVQVSVMESTRSDIIDLSQENEDDVVVAAVSRPITFGDGDALKTVNTMIARGDKIKTALYGTMDYKRWTPVASSVERYITGIQGTPYKAFRLVLVGTMSPGQRLTKASFEITPKDDGRIK